VSEKARDLNGRLGALSSAVRAARELDNRGSDRRGHAFEKPIFGNMGALEVM
jgi:hypothetical protein